MKESLELQIRNDLIRWMREAFEKVPAMSGALEGKEEMYRFWVGDIIDILNHYALQTPNRHDKPGTK